MFDRVLAVPLLTPTSPQIGLMDALRGLGKDFRVYDWYPRWASRTTGRIAVELEILIKEFSPTFTFLQIQTSGILSGNLLDKIPGYRFVWCGDLRQEVPQHAIDMGPHVDCLAFSNMRDVRACRAMGFNSHYLNIGVSLDVFRPDGSKREETPEIVAMLNNYPNRFPRSAFRARLVVLLEQRYGKRFEVFGSGWGTKNKWLDEETESAAYRTCKIAINANHFCTEKFTSDRLLRGMSSGAFMLSDRYPGIEEDYTEGEHLRTWETPEDLFSLIDHYLDDEPARVKIAAQGCQHVRTNHSWINRMDEIRRIVKPERVTA